MKAPKPGALVLLRWEDISEDPEWQDDDKPKGQVTVCESVAWVVRWGRHIVLTRTFGVTGGKRAAGDRLTIPRGVVLSCSVLRQPRKKQPK